jgi:N-methylhydantoinase B
VWLSEDGSEEEFLGAVFSNVSVESGAAFTRPSAGGGGYGDPLLRDPETVKEDVADSYVTPEGAKRDYGVVVREVDAELAEWEVDEAATEEERKNIRESRIGWLEAKPEELAQRYREGQIGTLGLIRRHGVILNWGTGELLPKTTEGFRAMLKRRAVPHWSNGEG